MRGGRAPGRRGRIAVTVRPAAWRAIVPAAALLAAALLPGAGAAAAQGAPQAGAASSGPPLSAELAGFGGAIIPLGKLTRNRFGFDTNLASTAAVGGEAAVWHGSGLGVGFEATYSRMAIDQSAGEQGFVLPGGLGEAEYLSGVLELRYRYRPAGARSAVQPEWGVGAGFRRLEVDPIARPDLEDSTDLIGSLRVAVYVPFGSRLGTRFGIRATRGAYGAGISDEEVSYTDILVGLGLVARLF